VKHLKIFSIFVVTALLLTCVAGCSSAGAKTTTTTEAFQVPADFTTYTDETGLYSIAYPNQWEPVADIAGFSANVKQALNDLNTGANLDAASMLFLSGLKNSTGYYPSVTMVVEPASVLMLNNDIAVQAEVNGIKQGTTNYQEVSRTKLSINGKSAAIVEYKANFSATTPLMHDYLLVCLSGKTIWTVTCTAMDTDYTSYSADFDNVFKSFQILK
jgi:hypothetical protein